MQNPFIMTENLKLISIYFLMKSSFTHTCACMYEQYNCIKNFYTCIGTIFKDLLLSHLMHL